MNGTGILDGVRASCAAVAGRARWVRFRPEGAEVLAERLHREGVPAARFDPEHHFLGEPAARLAFVLTLDAINFGSGWFPRLARRPGCSGYQTVASRLRDRFVEAGPWSAAELARMEAGELARVLGQERAGPEVGELLDLYARALRDLGRRIQREYGGRFEGLVEAAGGSAEALVALLARSPLYDDTAVHRGERVLFYKRAQITAFDLALAFGRRGPGRFRDLHRLTAFADNLVPHVLRMEGVLRLDPGLEARIDSGRLLAPGSEEEVELRALGVHAVEELVARLRRRGRAVLPAELDAHLWNLGQDPRIKAVPRHRCRTVFY